MELKIVQNNRSEIIKRNDIVAEFDQKTVPTRDEIRKNISAQLNIPIERIIIRKIDVKFGSNKGIALIKTYDTKEILDANEAKFVKKRNELKEVEQKSEEVTAE